LGGPKVAAAKVIWLKCDFWIDRLIRSLSRAFLLILGAAPYLLLLPGMRELDVDEAKERGNEIEVLMEVCRGRILGEGVRWLRMTLTVPAVVR
jgi:hypothetical protein